MERQQPVPGRWVVLAILAIIGIILAISFYLFAVNKK